MSLIIGLTGDVSGSSEYNMVYGVKHYYEQASSALERTGNMSLHKSLPVQSKMRRCVLKPDGTVAYYLNANDSTKKEDGTAANLTGADGNVMVEIPEHYESFSDNTQNKYYQVNISLYPFPNCIHKEKRYVSAYLCTIDRTNNKAASVVNTTAQYRGGNNNSSYDGTYRSFLGLHASNINISQCRTYAENIGSGWTCLDWDTYMVIYWLYVVEYANLNCQLNFNSTPTSEGYKQGGLGSGFTNIDWAKWITYNGNSPILPCGYTNSLGNNSGTKTFSLSTEQANAYGASFTTYPNSYRGIEFPWGYWVWVDGFFGVGDGTNQKVYICRDKTKYSNTLNSGYELKVTAPKFNWTYGKEIIRNDQGDLIYTNATGASSATYFCDCVKNNVENNTNYGLIVGGGSCDGSHAGFGCLSSHVGFGWAGVDGSFRVSYRK